jgi:hypothetical protein
MVIEIVPYTMPTTVFALTPLTGAARFVVVQFIIASGVP